MNYSKYHRTYHLQYSPGVMSDDKMVDDDSHFRDKEVVVTEKMDGENTSVYRDYIRARSIDSRHHESRDWVKNFWNTWKYTIPENVVIRGENLYARHSIVYDDLLSYFYAFSVEHIEADGDNYVLNWDNTNNFIEGLGTYPAVPHVPVIYRGIYNEKIICGAVEHYVKKRGGWDNVEGFVVRTVEGYRVSESKTHINKYVRPNHVQTNKHWSTQEVIRNNLKKYLTARIQTV